ncbi:MAG: hypothetical protein KC620_21545 [Myxococcales bacterium]|nr:hypothetical protein [Myxococcales bacterium]
MRRFVPIGLMALLMPAPAFANYQLLTDLINVALSFVGVLILVWVLALTAVGLAWAKKTSGARGVGLVAFIFGLLPGLLFLIPPALSVAAGAADEVTLQIFGLAAAYLCAAFIGLRVWRTQPAQPAEPPAD